MEIYESARRHGVSDEEMDHAIEHALVAAEEEGDKVLYLGPDRAGNLLEVVAVMRTDGTEVVIHAMRMRRMYEGLLPQPGELDG